MAAHGTFDADVQLPSSAAAPTQRFRWPAAAFRFVLLYLGLSQWCWIGPLMRNLARISDPLFNGIFGTLGRALGRFVFHIHAPPVRTHLLDTQLLYLELLAILIVSLLGAALWTVLDPGPRRAQLVYRYLRVWLRYVFAYMVLIYGVEKLFFLQFPFPNLSRLVQPLGDASPVTLMCNFMGFSPVYSFFAGLAEVVGGILLLWRRTALMGAVLLAIVMANITLMDFNYDFPVKMLALHFLLISLFLVSHDADRLWRVFVSRRSAPAADAAGEVLPWPSARVRRIIKVLAVLYVIVPVTIRNVREFRRIGLIAPRPPLYGLYAVDGFVRNGINHPPLTTDADRWRYLAIEPGPVWRAVTMDNRMVEYEPAYDPATHVAHLSASAGEEKGILRVSQAGAELRLDGTLGGQPLRLELAPVDVSRMTLVGRGFHWVSNTTYEP